MIYIYIYIYIIYLEYPIQNPMGQCINRKKPEEATVEFNPQDIMTEQEPEVYSTLPEEQTKKETQKAMPPVPLTPTQKTPTPFQQKPTSPPKRQNIQCRYAPQMAGNERVKIYDTEEESTKEIGLPPKFAIFGTACGMGENIYIAGEWSSRGEITPFIVIDVGVEKVRELSHLNTRRSAFTLTAISLEELIAIGGADPSKEYGERAVRECEIYNILEDKWVFAPPLNEGRYNHATCAFLEHKMVYVFGGYSDIHSHSVTTIENLSLGEGSNSWEIIHLENEFMLFDLPDSGCYLQALPIDEGKIIIFGEYYTLIFDTISLDIYTREKAPVAGKLDSGCVSSVINEGFIFCFNSTKTSEILKYDITKDYWEILNIQ